MIRPSGPEWSFSKTNPEPQLVVWPATQNTREHQQVYTMSYISPKIDPPTTPSPFSHALIAEFTTTGVTAVCEDRVPKAIAEHHWEAFSVELTVAPKMKASGWRPYSHNHGRPKMEPEMEGWWWFDDGWWWFIIRFQGRIILFLVQVVDLKKTVWLIFKKSTPELGTWIFVSLWLRFSQVYAFGITIHADSYSYLNLLYFQNVRNSP